MKTKNLFIALILFSTTSFAEVLTVDKFDVVKNTDGTFSINFKLPPIPENAHVDLAVLYVDVSDASFGASLNMRLKDKTTIIATGGIGKTRPETVGKQQSQFLLTQAIQKWVGEKIDSPSLLMELKSRAPSDFDLSAFKTKTKLVIYYTQT